MLFGLRYSGRLTSPRGRRYSSSVVKRGDTTQRAGIQLARKSKFLYYYRRLLAWDDKTVADYLGRYLNEEEIHALNTRRELFVRLIQKLIEVAGEANVLF